MERVIILHDNIVTFAELQLALIKKGILATGISSQADANALKQHFSIKEVFRLESSQADITKISEKIIAKVKPKQNKNIKVLICTSTSAMQALLERQYRDSSVQLYCKTDVDEIKKLLEQHRITYMLVDQKICTSSERADDLIEQILQIQEIPFARMTSTLGKSYKFPGQFEIQINNQMKEVLQQKIPDVFGNPT